MREAFFVWGQKVPSMPAMLRVGKCAIEGLTNETAKEENFVCFSAYTLIKALHVFPIKLNSQQESIIAQEEEWDSTFLSSVVLIQ